MTKKKIDKNSLVSHRSDEQSSNFRKLVLFVQVHIRTIISMISIIILLAILFYSWRFYRIRQERKISYHINLVVQQMLQLQNAPLESQTNFLYQEKKPNLSKPILLFIKKIHLMLMDFVL